MLTRKQIENVEEWMGQLKLKAHKCGYKERDKGFKEQFINGISKKEMMMEIIRQVTVT